MMFYYIGFFFITFIHVLMSLALIRVMRYVLYVICNHIGMGDENVWFRKMIIRYYERKYKTKISLGFNGLGLSIFNRRHVSSLIQSPEPNSNWYNKTLIPNSWWCNSLLMK